MKYTAADINILSFAYNGDVLKMDYQVLRGQQTVVLSSDKIMEALHYSGYCTAFVPEDREILVPVPRVGVNNPAHGWVSLEYFVKQNLDRDMAEKIILNHLNTVTA